MRDNRSTYRQNDELAEMFSKRNSRKANETVRMESRTVPVRPAADKTSTVGRERSQTAKRPQTSGKKKKSQLNSTIIYGVIIAFMVLCVIIGIVILASGGGGKKIESIKFTERGITMVTGETVKLPLVTEPAGMEKEVKLESRNDIIKINEDGTITAVSSGNGEITATYGDLKATCIVMVSRPEVAQSLDVDKKDIEISVGGGHKPVITAKPETAITDFYWESKDENIARVSEDGEITGVSEGTVNVVATDRNSGYDITFNVTVKGTLYAEGMKFSEEKVTLEIGQEYHSELVMTPTNITDKESIYYTTDLDIASVTNEGLITAKSVGTCTIEAYYARDNTIVAYLEVTVIDPFVITEKPEDESKPGEENSGGESGSTESGEESKPAKPTNGIEVIDGITYVQGILIANKTYALPSIYNPGTDDEAYNALDEMQSAAAKEGIVLYVVSGFRDYDTQEAIYNNYVSYDGKANADRYSARPGHSEHQTGLAFDLNELEESFGETREGKWLAANAHKYGFIIRYPKGKEHITGYMYEPWHVRYLGKDIATKVYNSGLTLEEYLGITSQYQD